MVMRGILPFAAMHNGRPDRISHRLRVPSPSG
jgi:hypothetical protein